MTLPHIIANQPATPPMPASFFDDNYNAVGAMGVTQCTAAGTNLLVLTPVAGQTAVAGYVNLQLFSFTAVSTSTGLVTAQVGNLAAVNVYLPFGTQAGQDSIVSGRPYLVMFLSALNSGAGGLIIISGGQSSPEPVNIQSGTSYTVTAGDLGKFLVFTNAAAIAVTLAQAIGAFGAGWWADFLCYQGTAGATTITPTTSVIDGASTLFLEPGQSARVVSDGVNYQVFRGGRQKTLRSYLAGLTLSNDAVTPNSVLDIAAGECADSTNNYLLVLGAFTKSTAGVWAAGAGANGMGAGLTVAVSTVYHVFAIINSGAVDVYFDTSVSAANKPAGTTAFRRLGSFKTDGSAHILGFTQDGDYFRWKASVLDYNVTNPGASATTVTLSVPTGVNVQAIINTVIVSSGAIAPYVLLSDLAANDEAPSASAAPLATVHPPNVNETGVVGGILVRTNTSGQIRHRADSSDASTISRISTLGWFDSRGTQS